MTLPEPVPGRLQAILALLPLEEREALEARLVGRNALGEWETTAEYLATVLMLAGYHVSASTIRSYRRSILVKEIVQ